MIPKKYVKLFALMIIVNIQFRAIFQAWYSYIYIDKSNPELSYSVWWFR